MLKLRETRKKLRKFYGNPCLIELETTNILQEKNLWLLEMNFLWTLPFYISLTEKIKHLSSEQIIDLQIVDVKFCPETFN